MGKGLEFQLMKTVDKDIFIYKKRRQRFESDWYSQVGKKQKI